MNVLVINSGSSSVKFQVIELPSETVLINGGRNRVGIAGGDFADHLSAISDILDEVPSQIEIHVVGHRVVHGGERFTAPTLIDATVIEGIDMVSPLAPLHNPANLDGIRAVEHAMPGIPQVAVFDTAFFSSLPAAASNYALPRAVTEKHGIRKYGFHGTSHQYVTQTLLETLPQREDPYRIISLHLGNGSSAAATEGGVAVDTSMGMTPLPGLVMGTRSGDIDPSIPLFLQKHAALHPEKVDELLNRESGLLGLAGQSDMRDLYSLASSGNERARHAIDVWVWRIKHYLGAYMALLGGVDAIIFTGGIGENQADLRAKVLDGLEGFGIVVDSEQNHALGPGNQRISPESSEVSVWVIPTNEELQIARLAAECVGV